MLGGSLMTRDVAIILGNTFLAALLFGGMGYAVFWLGHSPWWFVASVFAYVLTYTRTGDDE